MLALDAEQRGDDNTAFNLRRYINQKENWIEWIDFITAVLPLLIFLIILQLLLILSFHSSDMQRLLL